ncbi:RNA recognition motif domain [Trinorchestia longiramus]|nr:RNA recognition motif domain [Trinorchestia longiramus]
MAISDKEAFRILDLPLGVDKDAITSRYRTLSSKLASSRATEDVKKLERVVQAYNQLLPPHKRDQPNNVPSGGPRHRANDDAANMSALLALQRKADKKKEKKKRRKEKKKTNDKSENKFITNNGKIGGEDSDCSSDADEEAYELPGNLSARGVKAPLNSNGATVSRKAASEDNLPNIDPEVLRNRQVQARSMAVQGNEAAGQGLHQRAVKLFTQAACFDPSDHRFLGNRSYCYEQLKQYDKALNDADKAIQLSPDWPKGHFRRGRALCGLGLLTEAEEAFSRVLQLDPACQEAQEEISNVQSDRLTEMGFTVEQSTRAIQKYQQVQPALDALLAGEFHEATGCIFYSDGEDEEGKESSDNWKVSVNQPIVVKKPYVPDDIKMNPRNPQGLTSLWVGNVLPVVTEKELQKLFSKYGHVSSVRQLKEKFCAFVNFSESSSAGRAMNALQGHTVSGQRLLIKFPDNPISSNVSGPQGGARRRNTMGLNRQGGL